MNGTIPLEQKHSHGFVFFLCNTLKLKALQSEFLKLSRITSLAMALKLVYLDFSLQDLSSVDVLLNGNTQHNIETLILYNCKNIEFKHLFNAT